MSTHTCICHPERSEGSAQRLTIKKIIRKPVDNTLRIFYLIFWVNGEIYLTGMYM